MMTLPVTVSVPPHARYARILRAVASAAASEIGMRVDTLDDLSLAIDEASATLLHIGGATSIECAFTVSTEAIDVQLRGIGAEADPWPPAEWDDSLEGIVLGGVTEGLTMILDDGHPAIAFTLSP